MSVRWGCAILVSVGAGCGVEAADPGSMAPTPLVVHGSRNWAPLAPLVATYDVGGVVVRAPWPGAPEVGLALASWGPEGALAPAEVVAPGADGQTRVYDRTGIREWWKPTPSGLEHGFDVDAATAAGVTLVLELVVTGARAQIGADGVSAVLVPERGGGGLRYEGLAAWDEQGTTLPARMEGTVVGLRLVVDATDAVGAVTIDPLLPGAAWGAESNQDSASFGGSVASAGDVNGDGYDDVVIGAENYDAGQFNEGAAFLYLGSAAGLSAVPAWAAESDQAMAFFGGSVASAGDVNGDGYDDVIVGAEYYDNGQAQEGAAFLYLGSAAGLSAAPA